MPAQVKYRPLKKRRNRAFLFVLTCGISGLVGCSCSWQEVVNGTTRTHYVVVDTDTEQFDAHHGDTIDVVLTGDDQSPERCDDYGGDELIYSPVTGLYVCEDVDF